MSNAAALALARGRGWRTLLWSHWGRDWEARATPESIAALLTGGAGPGSVLLLHDADDYSAPSSWRRTVAALPRVLDTLARAGSGAGCALIGSLSCRNGNNEAQPVCGSRRW